MVKQPKPQKLKTYVLMVSLKFPAYHPRKGQETGFPDAIVTEDKRHTCRGNYALWAKRAAEVQAGRAVISLRYWEGKPYNSKQIEFCVLNCIHVQKVHVYQIARTQTVMFGGPTITKIFIEDSIIPLRRPELFAAHDGLSFSDFNNWFKKPLEDGCIIHFTEFKYNVTL